MYSLMMLSIYRYTVYLSIDFIEEIDEFFEIYLIT